MRTYLFIGLMFASSTALAGSISFGGTGSGSASFGGTGSGSVAATIAGAEPEAPPSDGVIGRTTSDDTMVRTNTDFYYSSYTPTTAGTVNYCSAYVQNMDGSNAFTLGIYSTAGTILGYTNVDPSATSIAWYTGTLNTPVVLAEGTEYFIGLVSNDSSWSIGRKNSLTGKYRRRIAMSYATTLSNADFSSPTSDLETSEYRLYCDNVDGVP